jgi:hypothetical protein
MVAKGDVNIRSIRPQEIVIESLDHLDSWVRRFPKTQFLKCTVRYFCSLSNDR